MKILFLLNLSLCGKNVCDHSHRHGVIFILSIVYGLNVEIFGNGNTIIKLVVVLQIHNLHPNLSFYNYAEMYWKTVSPSWSGPDTRYRCHQSAATLFKESSNIWGDTEMHGYYKKSDIGTHTHLTSFNVFLLWCL